MTTRGSLARGLGKETFQGRVQKWVRKLTPVGGGQGARRLTILKWVPTGEKAAATDRPRWPHIVPVRGSEVHAPLSPQQRQATQAAAPTLRLKLRPGSDAQASAPGSEDEDASRPTGEAGAASRADGQEAQSPRPASAAHRAAAAAAAAALADGDAHVAAQHPRALVTAAPAAVQAREPEETAGPREHAERAASVAAAPAAVQESGQRDASDAPGRDTAPASQSADRGGAEPAPSGAAAAGAPQGAEVAEPRSPAAPTPPLDCRPDQAQGPAGSSGGGGEAAAGGAGAKRGREGDAGVAADTKGALPGTEDSTGLADDPAAAAAHKRARLGEGPGGDGAALSAGGAPPGHVSDGVPAPEAANGATP